MDEWTSKMPSSRWLNMNTVRQDFYMPTVLLIWRQWKIRVTPRLIGTMSHSTQVMNCHIPILPCTITFRIRADIHRMYSHFPSIYRMTLQQRYVLVIIKTTALVIHWFICRNLFLAWRITCLHVCRIASMMATITSTQPLNETWSEFLTIVYIHPRFYASISLHMMYVMSRTQWTHKPTAMWWYCHLSQVRMPIHSGMPKSLACFMLGSFTRILLLPTNLSRISSFSGSAGLDSFLIGDLDSRKHDCPKLAFSRIQIHLHSAFWTLLWSYGVAILSWLLLMERLLTCSQSCAVLLDHPMSMRTGWPSTSWCMYFYYYCINSTYTNACVPDLLTGICSCITGVVVLGM